VASCYALGRAGERFAVRNSEPAPWWKGRRPLLRVHDRWCGRGAGRHRPQPGRRHDGGVAFLLDEEDALGGLLNPEIVSVHPLQTPEQEQLIKPLLEAHLEVTGSRKAAEILANWPQWRPRFKVLVPPSELATVGLLEREKLAMAT
jgi:glutamate synthase (ferredoxin)